ncbi:class I adenylate-forming enzyme family protein [Cellulosimicrobium cellulans]|uniref:class I adenylate-forming enzyme family protein n=1 Tax=Cellulosimicrobium cellulans TaxID=1710 RepID=UPI002405782E|nr:AMP-binding protein [Cellulosimicrobium cellulans]MDF9875643.1 long-chain acyl-CoA synthetase [Cellulosimicrobium cellulans]
MPVAHQVLTHAADPAVRDRPALRTPERSRTYAALAADVRAGATHLTATGTRPGDLVAVSLPDPLDLLTAVLAADHAGATPLVCDTAWPRAHRAEVLRTLAPRTFVEVPLPRGTGAVPDLVPGLAPQGGAGPGHVPAPDDLAWAGFSSGSTGRPRAVVRTRASWAGSFDDVTQLLGLRPTDTVLVPGPLASSLYCFAAVHTLAVGACAYLTRTPAATTSALASSDVVHLVPQVLDDVLDAVAAGAPSRLRHAVVGGASLAPGARSRAAALGIDVLAYYGAVELSFVAYDPDGSGLRAFPGVDLAVRPLPAASVGEVWVRSPWVSRGYLARATGPLRRDGAWSTVGDLADPLPATGAASSSASAAPGGADRGGLVLRGRGDGAILTGGSTVVPEDVEVVLRAVPGVRDVVVLGTVHRRLGAVVSAVVECDDRPGLRAHLERVARAALAPAQRPRRWYGTRALPRTPSGKPARGAVSEALHGTDPARSGLEPLR